MKLKMIAAALAIGLSAQAQAALQNTTEGGVNGGSLVLAVGSKAGGVSGIFDLGYNVQDFMPSGVSAAGTTISWNLNTGSVLVNGVASSITGNWASAWSALAGQPGLIFGVLGSQTGPGIPKNTITTVADADVGKATTSTQANTFATVYNNFTNANELVAGGTHGSSANGANTATGSVAYAFNTLNTNWRWGTANTTWSLGQAIDTDMQLSLINLTGSTVTNQAYAGSMFLSNDGILTYAVAAVPEPEGYAMLIAGLGLVGAMVRRRKDMAA